MRPNIIKIITLYTNITSLICYNKLRNILVSTLPELFTFTTTYRSANSAILKQQSLSQFEYLLLYSSPISQVH